MLAFYHVFMMPVIFKVCLRPGSDIGMRNYQTGLEMVHGVSSIADYIRYYTTNEKLNLRLISHILLELELFHDIGRHLRWHDMD